MMTKLLLLNVSRTLAIIPTAELEKVVNESEDSLARAEAFGPLFQPTEYLKADRDGTMEDARHQLKIVKHLLAARKAIDEREAFVASKRSK